MTFLDRMITVPWALMACGCGVGYMMIRQGNRLVERLEAVEAVLYSVQDELADGKEEESDGLPAGSQAPAFELANLQGLRTSLEQFRGKPVLLIFFSPTCAFCQRMAPDLARLPLDGAGGRLVPVVVTSGDPDANRAPDRGAWDSLPRPLRCGERGGGTVPPEWHTGRLSHR